MQEATGRGRAGLAYTFGAPVALGVAFLLSRPRLTPWRWLDVVELILAAVVLPPLLRRARWAVLVWSALALAVCGLPGLPLVVGAIVIGVYGWRSARQLLVGWACVALVVVVALRPLHRSTWLNGWVVAVGLIVTVVAAASDKQPDRVRAASRYALLALGVLALLCAVFGGRAMLPARTLSGDLRTAIDSLRAGQVDSAITALERSAAGCSKVEHRLGGPPGLVLRAVPGLGAQVDGGADFADLCADELSTLGSSIAEIRTILTPVDQQVDIAGSAEVPQLLDQARASMRRVHDATLTWLDQLPIPHTPDSITSRLATLDHIDHRLDDVEDLANQLPRLLGADGQRRYFIMFLTEAESRPLVGHMGNWALVTVDAGKVTLERSGRAADLNLFNYDNKEITGLDEFRSRFEGYLRGGVNTKTDPDIWSLFTITPDLPTAGEVVRQLAPQSGIGDIDGVIAVDIGSVAKLVTLSGPAEFPQFGVTLDAENARQMLLVDQYRLFPEREQRVQFLQAVADELTNRLFQGRTDLPSAAAALRTSLDEGAFGLWLVDPTEQAAAARAGAAPSYPQPLGRDGFVVNSTNRSPNKLDSFLQRTVSYEAVIDPQTGDVHARGTVELTNTFDPNVKPQHSEAANEHGDPAGSIRSLTCLDTPFDLVDASEPISDYDYLGWREACVDVITAPGETATLWIEMEGTLDLSEGYCFVSRGQVTALPDRFHVKVTTTDGQTWLDTDLDGPRAEWLAGPACAARAAAGSS